MEPKPEEAPPAQPSSAMMPLSEIAGAIPAGAQQGDVFGVNANAANPMGRTQLANTSGNPFGGQKAT